jgi:hypothetical protein
MDTGDIVPGNAPMREMPIEMAEMPPQQQYELPLEGLPQ